MKLEHVPRSVNKMADVLANLVATLALGLKENINVPVYGQWVITSFVDEGEDEVKVVLFVPKMCNFYGTFIPDLCSL